MTDSTDDADIGSALYEDYIERKEILQNKINKNKLNKIWETSSGEKINFINLTSSHKSNIIKFCNKHELINPFMENK